MRSSSTILLGLLATLAAAGPARGDEPERLEPYLPPGISARDLRRALDDDLGSGLNGAIPTAFLHAVLTLEPERFGRTVEEAWARYGFLFLRGRSLPVGICATRRLGVRAYQFNCLACHAGRGQAGAERGLLVVGATNHTLDFTGWYRDVLGALPRLVQRERKRLGIRRLGSIERAALTARSSARLICAARKGLRRARRRLGPTEALALTIMARGTVESLAKGEEPRGGLRYGPGRTVVQQAYRVLRFKLKPGPYAPVKPPDLFGVRHRKTLLWTGNETYDPHVTVAERIARNGMLVPWIQINPLTREPIPDRQTLRRFPRYLKMGKLLAASAPPPAPAPTSAAERAALTRGQALFQATCSRCHGEYRLDPATTPDGKPGLLARVLTYPEKLLSPDDVGTDPAYTRSNDATFLKAFDRSLLGRARLFNGRVTEKYVARPLLGLRLRAPFLHNGSVPSLRWMLTEPAQRPAWFYVGPGVPHDPAAVGLRFPWSQARPGTARRTTTASGNQARGHPFGTDMSPAEKTDLLAYLRRL